MSPTLLKALGEVLRYPRLRRRHRWSDRQRARFVDNLAAMAVVAADRLDLHVVADDPDDDAVLACALEGMADFVVTGDQHLLAFREWRKIRIVRPGQFLSILGAR